MVRIVLPDVHIPFQDKTVVNAWLTHAQQLKPDAVDIIGDVIDAYPLSDFNKNPERKHSVQREIDDAVRLLDDIRSAVGNKTEIHYSEGNHEERLRRLLWGRCSALAGIRNLTMPELMGLEKRKIQWHSEGKPYCVNGIWFLHGEIIRKHSGATARATADRVDGGVIMGHSHRMGWCPTTSALRCRDAWEVGHVSDFRKLEYVSGVPQWQQGWAVVHFGHGWTDVSFVRVYRRPGRHGTSFVYQGKELNL